ncbi:MAG TPA: recombinase family protein [Armatimonadota bacterium]
MTDSQGKRAIIYARVSTELQERDGVGLPSQLEACRELALRDGYEVVEEVRDEGYSGTTLSRPGLDRALELLFGGAATVLIAHGPDRLSRDAASLLWLHRDLQRHGVSVVFVKGQSDDTPEGKLLFGMQAIIADYERLQILERTTRGMRHIARQGRLPKLCEAYGYRFVTKRMAEADPSLCPGTLLVMEEQAAVVRRIYDLCCSGASLRGIATVLNDEGIPTKQGKRWNPAVLRCILRNPAYRGELHYGARKSQRTGRYNSDHRETKTHVLRPESEHIIVPVPALVTPEQWQQAQDRLRRNQEQFSGRPSKHLLVGILQCADCGLGFVYHQTRGIGYYYCRAWDQVTYGDRCPQPPNHHPAARLEEAVRRVVRDVLTDPERLSRELDARRQEEHIPREEAERELEHLRDALQALTAEEMETLRLAAQQRFSAAAVEGVLEDVRRRREALESQERALSLMLRSEALEGARQLSLREFAAAIRARLEGGLTPAEEKALYRLIIHRIRVHRSGRLEIELFLPPQDVKTVAVTEEVFRYNLEGEGLEDTLVEMMSRQVSVDLCDLAWNGDTTDPAATTLSAAITAATPADGGTLSVASTAGYPTAGTLLVGTGGTVERIQYDGLTGTAFKGVTRGADGTVKQAFSSGTAVDLATDGLLTATDGWLKKASASGRTVDGFTINSGILCKEHFQQALAAMPNQYLSSPSASRFRWILHPRQRVNWLNYLASRATAAGDAALLGPSGVGLPYGWPILEDPTLPVGTVVFTDPKNLVLGVALGISIKRDASSRDVISRGVRYYQIDLAADVQIEQSNAVVKVTGLAA